MLTATGGWWRDLADRWDWTDPVVVLAAASLLVTAAIPVLIAFLGKTQSTRDSRTRERQAASLDRQEQLLRRQRRDTLLDTVAHRSDSTHLAVLWEEIQAFDGRDRDILRTVFRGNVALALPGSSDGLSIADDLDQPALDDYVGGLSRRYEMRRSGLQPYPGLLAFLARARGQGLVVPLAGVVDLVTGPTASAQRPGHQFYRELVTTVPEAAASLLHRFEDIDPRAAGSVKFNLMTGVMLALKDAELGRIDPSRGAADAASVFRRTVPGSLAQLMHRENFRSIDRWSLADATEAVSAMAAWLVRAVGWLADEDPHLAMRMIENLPSAVESAVAAQARDGGATTPAPPHGWGVDEEDVDDGLSRIRTKRPGLWALHEARLLSAVEKMGPV